MAKLKAKKDIVLPLVGTLKAGSVIDNTSLDVNSIIFKDTDGATYTLGGVVTINQFDKVDDSTPTSVIVVKSQLAENVEGGIKKMARKVQIAGAVGTVAGLGFAYYRKSKWYGYLGWAILFGGVASIGTGVFLAKKTFNKIKDDSQK